MGRGKQTNKLYITHSEWSNEYGGMSFGGVGKKRSDDIFRRLPFFCCALSLQPFEHPMCTEEGDVFDLVNIVPYLKKHGRNPVTGQKLEAKSLVKLNFHKNANGEYHCPVTYRVFTDHTHIVAIRTSGNVYSHDAVERLNIKPKYWVDLLSDEPFTRKDIITIQDPHNVTSRNLERFWHLQSEGKGLVEEGAERPAGSKNINAKGTTQRALAELEATAKKVLPSQAPIVTKPQQPYNTAHFTTGAAAASFTSTAAPLVTTNERSLIDEEEFMFKQIKTKGYARIETNMGNINVELFCDQTPRTCYNFIQLAKSNYYKDVIFHRSIKNFMIQGGDPTGTGKGGESFWKKDFADEVKHNLSHNARGLLSMANRGPGTNSSQFFVTYRPCKHLDGKHTIFGNVVGGLATLDKLEAVPTDEDDRPTQKIVIRAMSVFVDPFEEFRQRLQRKLKYQAEEAERVSRPREPGRDETETWLGSQVKESIGSEEEGVVTGSGCRVGMYLQEARKRVREHDGKDAAEVVQEDERFPVEKEKRKKTGFSDFSSW